MNIKDFKITFVNHACYLLEYNGIGLLVDPWLNNSVFNNGWMHISKTVFDENIVKKITHIWYSHEHPDHFSPYDLKILKTKYNIDPVILFQKTKDKRVKRFCEKMDFRFLEMDNWKKFKIIDGFYITIIRAGMIDSLHVLEIEDKKIINLNDCILSNQDLEKISKKFVYFDLLFTQFSYASWTGNREDFNLRRDAVIEKEKDIISQINYLKPICVIPFASFIFFCHEENKFMNDQIADLENVCNIIKKNNSQPIVLYPGSIFSFDHDYKKYADNISKYKTDFYNIKDFNFIKTNTIELIHIEEASYKYFKKIKKENNYFLMILIHHFAKALNSIYKKDVLGLCGVNIMISDQNKIYRFNWFRGFHKINSTVFDIKISSESLKFIFDFDFGIGTVLINARGEYKNLQSLYIFKRIFMLGILNSTKISLFHLICNKILRTFKIISYDDRVIDGDDSFSEISS